MCRGNSENYEMFGRVIIFVTEKGALIFPTVLRPDLSEVGMETSYVRDSSVRNHEAGFTRLDL